jgi:hypothetical protein
MIIWQSCFCLNREETLLPFLFPDTIKQIRFRINNVNPVARRTNVPPLKIYNLQTDQLLRPHLSTTSNNQL